MNAPSDLQKFLAAQEKKSLLRFLTCGSVDDGKSTLDEVDATVGNGDDGVLRAGHRNGRVVERQLFRATVSAYDKSLHDDFAFWHRSNRRRETGSRTEDPVSYAGLHARPGFLFTLALKPRLPTQAFG